MDSTAKWKTCIVYCRVMVVWCSSLDYPTEHLDVLHFIGSSTSSDAVEQNVMQCSLSLAALYFNTVYCNIKVGAKLQCTFYQCNMVNVTVVHRVVQ